jgi:hypothetical protein
MPKFLAGYHYNEEEISRHLKNDIEFWPVQINDNKFATGQIVEKPVEVVEGADSSWLSSKVSPTLIHRTTVTLFVFKDRCFARFVVVSHGLWLGHKSHKWG